MTNLNEYVKYEKLDLKNLSTVGNVSLRHKTLLKSYLLNLNLGYDSVRNLIQTDIKYSIDIGATELAQDLRIILELYDLYCKKNHIVEFI